MKEKTYYVSQVPVESIVFTVKDENRKPRSLAAYDTATVFFTNPNGVTVNGGVATISDPTQGRVIYAFPENTLFGVQGQYRVQLRLESNGREDYTDVLTIRVVNALEGGIQSASNS